MIELKGVTRIYDAGGVGETVGIQNVNLLIGNRGMVAFFGPSGSGKTTLLNLIGGLDEPTEGEVLVDGAKVDDRFRLDHVGCVFQDFVLLESITVAENIRLLDRSITDAEIDQALQSLGILELRERKAGNLSGGEKQRVCLARAIVKKPAYLLADEPTGNLDGPNRTAIMRILKSLSKHFPVLLVSHEKELVEEYADRIIRLEDGRIVGDSAPTVEPGEPFPLQREADAIVPRRKIKRKRSNLLSGILATLAVVASCFAAGLVTGKAESTNHATTAVYRLNQPLSADSRTVLSPYCYFGKTGTMGTALTVGDGAFSQRTFYWNSGPFLPLDFHADGNRYSCDAGSILLTEAAAKDLLEHAYSPNGSSIRNLMLSQYGFQKPEDLIGLPLNSGLKVSAIIPGNDVVGYVGSESFYRERSSVTVGGTSLGFTYYSSMAFRRFVGVELPADAVYVRAGHPLAEQSTLTFGEKTYPVRTHADLADFEEAILPAYAHAYLQGEKVTWAYAWDEASFGKLIKTYKGVDAVSLHETKAAKIRLAKTIYASVIGGVGLASLAVMAFFYVIDIGAYFEENKNEFVVCRCLGLSRRKLYIGSLEGILLGALPSLGIGTVAGMFLTLFLCRSEEAALYFVPGALTFALGAVVAATLVFVLASVLLWKKLSPTAAEFKRMNLAERE